MLRGSSDLPGGLARRASTPSGEPEVPPYLVLLRVGFALPATLLRRRCALTAPFHPYPAVLVSFRSCPRKGRRGLRNTNTHQNSGAVYFLWHFPSADSALAETASPEASRTLSGTLLCGVRTFLPAHSRKRRYGCPPARMGGATVRSDCQHLIIFDDPRRSRRRKDARNCQPAFARG